MKVTLVKVAAVIGLAIPLVSVGQQLSSADKPIIDAARSKYYNLESEGFQSLTCLVRFDLSTIPALPSDPASRKLLEETSFILMLDAKGRPSVEHRYPDGTPDDAKQQISQAVALLNSFAVGLFQTWPSKGLFGPIPPFDSQIERVAKTDQGFTFFLRIPGAPVEIHTDKNFLVNEIVSVGGKLKEHPKYEPSPKGLVFAGNEALDDSRPENPVAVRYEFGSGIVEGLVLPHSVRLRVNDNIDVRYSLETCSVKKAMVLRVAPPLSTSPQK
jgi:hypothetical protein